MRHLNVLWFVALAACQSVSGLSELALKHEDGGAGMGDSGPDVAGHPEGGAGGMAGGGMGGVPAGGAGVAGIPMGGVAGIPMGGMAGVPSCMPAAGLECDYLTDCGCSPDKHCQKRGADAKPTCVPRGPRQLGESCKTPDDCARGTCDHHTCRAYCDDRCDAGKCLPAADADDKPIAGVDVCWMSCQIDNQKSCLDGTTCQQLMAGGTKGAYCQPPADPCPTVWNGVCDEPNVCAPGTDTMDCSCKRSKEGAACDLVGACGCKEGSSCRASEADHRTPSCQPHGTVDFGGLCAEHEDCAPGLGCYGSICKKFCAADPDCPTSRDKCFSTSYTGANRETVENTDVKVCRVGCELPAGTECKEGTACRDYGNGEAYCVSCPHEQQGAECGLVKNCGCDGFPGTGCALDLDDKDRVTARCLPAGPGPVGSVCGADSDCTAGSACVDNTCHWFCNTELDCEAGSCLAFTKGGQEVSVGACFEDCTVPGFKCAANTTCGKIELADKTSIPACVLLPLTTTCPTANKRCDDPTGTGLCAAGSDAAECK